MIPKVIHYCWFGGNPLPSLAIQCIQSWKTYCPNYEIMCWNESNFNVNLCAYTREAYEQKKWAFVSDYARFWILYKYGGIYFDTDVELIKPIDDLIKRGSFMGLEQYVDFSKIVSKNKLIVANPGLGLAASPGLTLYKFIIDYYNKEHFVNQRNRIDQTTVVDRTSKILRKLPVERITSEYIKISGVYIYQKDYFCPLDYYTGQMRITKNTRSIHHYTASWMSEEELENARVFREMKEKYGTIFGKILGYFKTFPLRAKIYGIKKAIFLRE